MIKEKREKNTSTDSFQELMEEKDVEVRIKVIEIQNENIDRIKLLQEYFRLFLGSIPSSMPCPCCGGLIVSPKRILHYEEVNSPLLKIKQMMQCAVVDIIDDTCQKNNYYLLALCKKCYSKGKETPLYVPRHYIVDSREILFNSPY